MKQEYYDYLVNVVKLKPFNIDLSSNVKQKMECLLCDNSFEAIPKGKVNNFRKHNTPGCKKCTQKERYADNQQEYIDNLEINYDIIKLPKDVGHLAYNDKIIVKRKACSHTFPVNWYNIKGKAEYCPVCNTERKRENFIQFNEEKHQESLSKKSGFEEYKQQVNKLTRETYRKYKGKINPNNYLRVLSGEQGYHLDHIISVRNSFDLGVPPEVCADYRNLRMVEWKLNNKKWKRSSLRLPEPFIPYVNHDAEQFIKDVKDYLPKMEKYADSFGGKFMLTLYSEENNFGIYFAPLKTNSEQMLGSKNYFKEMKTFFERAGIKILIIFGDEWLLNKTLVIRKIQHYMGINATTAIHARKCVVKSISVEEKNRFLNEYHIQGTCVSQINIGAFYKDVLISVLTFANPRVLMNKKQQDTGVFELTRFATHIDYRIPGIFSKLLKYFVRNYTWKMIYSFADKRWSDGKLYDKCGFTLETINPPNYFYLVDNKRKHRWGYRKDALREKFPNEYDPTKTEYQNMLDLGYDRIWDSGSLKYVLVK